MGYFMKSLYDFDIYYNNEKLDDIVYIDDDYVTWVNGKFIKIEYIKDTKLVTIIDNVEKFSFVRKNVYFLNKAQ